MTTSEKWFKKAAERHGDRYDYSKVDYVHSHKKVTIICKKHGEFQQIAAKHTNGGGCRKCCVDNIKASLTKSTDDFIKKSNITHNGKYDYSLSEYGGALKKIKIICPTHGMFEIRASEHANGKGCKKCNYESYGRRRCIGLDGFLKKARAVHGDEYDYSKVNYTDNRLKVIIICRKHGEFLQKASHHMEKTGCPKCGRSVRQYALLNIIKQLFKGYKVLSDHKHDELRFKKSNFRMELDIFIPNRNLAIEYQGEFHYQPYHGEDVLAAIKKRDKEKKAACKKFGIKLICINYRWSGTKESVVKRLIKEGVDI